jgi:hypothetical protein
MLALSSIFLALASFFGAFGLMGIHSDAAALGRAGFLSFIVLSAVMLAAGVWTHGYRHPLRAHYR